MWCSNNWRMKQGLARTSNHFRPRRADVLWRNQKDDVLKEIAKQLGLPTATTQTNGWFAARMPAIKTMIENMTLNERNELDAQVEAEAQKGYGEKEQRR